MAYNEKLVDRIREALEERGIRNVEEKKMFRGMTFMVDDKMCIGVSHDDLMCRIDPAMYEEAVKRKGCRAVEMRGRVYRGYIYVDEAGFKLKKDFDQWVDLTLTFNKHAKVSKKKKPTLKSPVKNASHN